MGFEEILYIGIYILGFFFFWGGGVEGGQGQ